MSHQRTLDQERAKQAWQCVKDAQAKDEGFQKRYRQLCRGATADIQTYGLAQTLAFWRAKAKKEAHHQALLKDISVWVLKRPAIDDSAFLNWIVAEETKTDDYRRATAEALAFLNWVKRFAEAELKEA